MFRRIKRVITLKFMSREKMSGIGDIPPPYSDPIYRNSNKVVVDSIFNNLHRNLWKFEFFRFTVFAHSEKVNFKYRAFRITVKIYMYKKKIRAFMLISFIPSATFLELLCSCGMNNIQIFNCFANLSVGLQ